MILTLIAAAPFLFAALGVLVLLGDSVIRAIRNHRTAPEGES